MDFNKEAINEILNALDNCGFTDLYEEVFYDEVVHPFKQKYKKPFTHNAGATKGVLIFKELGFVIKIPFNFNGDGEHFCGADDSGPGWNYCEVEEIKYEKAQIFGVKDCFAGTYEVGKIGEHPVYIQEYAEMFSEGGSPSPKEKTREELERIEDMCDGMAECFNNIWLSDALDFFGEKQFYNLLNFIDDYNISDLHDANIGYIGMRPVLVDYSSFND